MRISLKSLCLSVCVLPVLCGKYGVCPLPEGVKIAPFVGD